MVDIPSVLVGLGMAAWSIGLYHTVLRPHAYTSDWVKLGVGMGVGVAGGLGPLFVIGRAKAWLQAGPDWVIVAASCWLLPFGSYVIFRVWKARRADS